MTGSTCELGLDQALGRSMGQSLDYHEIIRHRRCNIRRLDDLRVPCQFYVSVKFVKALHPILGRDGRQGHFRSTAGVFRSNLCYVNINPLRRCSQVCNSLKTKVKSKMVVKFYLSH
jgi:hypothetical protein